MARIEVRSCGYGVTRWYAAHVAARLRRELNAEVDLVEGPYGQFRVLIDGEVAFDGGALAALGVLPSGRTVVEAVRERLAKSPDTPPDERADRF